MARDEDFRSGPPSKKRAAADRRRDEDDYDDDRPRRRRKSESNLGLWIGLGVGGGVLLIAVIVLVIVLNNRSDPNRVVVQFGDGPQIPIDLPKDMPNPFPGGKIQFPNPGDFPNPFPNGKMPFPNGKMPFPNGKFPFPDGKIQIPNPGDFQNPFQGGNDQRFAKIIPGDRFAFIQAAVNAKRLENVNITGFNIGQEYRDVPPEGALLVGFQAGVGQFFDSQTVNSLRPIYLTRGGEKMGNWLGQAPPQPITVKAKAGYVLGSINIRTGLFIDGMSVKFMKLNGDRIQETDSYDSEWIGGNGGGPGTIGGQGRFFAGICGHLNDQKQPVSLGLVTVLNSK
jgi:hypothetical protein